MSDCIVVRIHPNEELARTSIKIVLDKFHERRFKSEVLDFYRNDYTRIMARHDTLDDVMFLVAIQDDIPIGLSVCHLLNSEKKVKHSLTVVTEPNRRAGIGKRLLASKIAFLSNYYPHLAIRSYVNKSNDAGVRLCNSSGLKVIRTGTKELKVTTKSKDDRSYNYTLDGDKPRRKAKKAEPTQEIKKIEYFIYGV